MQPVTSRVHSLLVGVANPQTLPRLMDLAGAISTVTTCCVAACHVVVTPRGEAPAPEALREATEQAEALLQQASRYAAERGTCVDSFVEVAPSVPEGLLSAATVEDADALLVGYSDEIAGADAQERAFDRIMHRVAHGYPGNTIVAKFRGEAMRRVAVPVVPNARMAMVATIVDACVRTFGSEVAFYHAPEPRSDPEEQRRGCRQVLSESGLAELGQLHLVHDAHPEAGLIEAISGCDLCIVAAGSKPGITHAVFGSTAERIAARSATSVVLVRSGRGRACEGPA